MQPPLSALDFCNSHTALLICFPLTHSPVYAAYGFQLTAQNHTGSLGGYLLNGTDFKDLAQHENLRGDFNVSLLLPNNDASSYVEGQRMFSVALYGVEEALNYPQVFLYNQTVTVK